MGRAQYRARGMVDAPLVTTLIDASGVLIYFSIATAVLASA